MDEQRVNEIREMSETRQSPPETPSATSASSIGREDGADRPKKARRTFLTQNACSRCRLKKSKCDGRRPTCGRCEKNGADCTYDVAQEGLTRMQSLQQQLESKTEEYNRLMHFFITLQSGTDNQATTLLARLRLGESIDDLIGPVGSAQSSSPGKQRSPPNSQERRGSSYIQSWPPSPLQDGSWVSWSSRCQPDIQAMSQTSGPDGLKQEPSLPSAGSSLNMRDEYHHPEPRNGYYPLVPPDGFHQPTPNPPFSQNQWQTHNPQLEDTANVTGSAGPYYGDPEQLPNSSMRRS